MDDIMRIDQFLSSIQWCSRRDMRDVIKLGLWLDGERVTDAGQKVSPGQLVRLDQDEVVVRDQVMVLLYKPAEYLCSEIDEKYPSYKRLLEDCPYRPMLRCAGRLDLMTEGLVIASTDGQMVHRIISPRHHLPKTYYVQCESPITAVQCELLRAGLWIANDKGERYESKPAIVQLLGEKELNLTIYEGKYHQVRDMLRTVGNLVVYLRRESIGEWTLEGLEKGKRRYG